MRSTTILIRLRGWQADLSLHWLHKSYYGFCHAMAQNIVLLLGTYSFISERKHTHTHTHTHTHIFEGAWCVGKQTGSHKSCLPCKIWRKIVWVYPFLLISLDKISRVQVHTYMLYFGGDYQTATTFNIPLFNKCICNGWIRDKVPPFQLWSTFI